MSMKICKECGTEVSSQGKCPKCGKDQRNFFIKHKVVTFLLIVVVLGAIAGAGGNETKNNETVQAGTNSINKETTQANTNKPEQKTKYNVGETYSSKYIKIKYLSLNDYTSTNQFIQPSSGNKYIRLEFEFENISNADQGVYSSFFKCYADGYDMESKWLDNYLSSTTLSAGKKTKGYIYFEVPKDAQEIAVEYEDNIWTSNKVEFIVK